MSDRRAGVQVCLVDFDLAITVRSEDDNAICASFSSSSCDTHVGADTRTTVGNSSIQKSCVMFAAFALCSEVKSSLLLGTVFFV